MKSCRLLLDADLRDAIESMGAVIGMETSVIDSQPVRRSANLRLFQIDIPDVPARVFEETAKQAGVSLETLLMDWISQCGRETSRGAGAPQRILSRCRRIADWCLLGYTDQADEIAALATRLLRD